MNFTVVWNPGAKNDLADLWISTENRAAITRAADVIDRSLRQNPFANSESRGAGNSRIMIISPLAVAYDVSVDDRLVTVWAVWKTTK